MSEQGGDTRIELMFRLEAALKRIEALEVALQSTATAIEALAFEMPPPNPYTPQFVMIANSARAALTPEQGFSGEDAAFTARHGGGTVAAKIEPPSEEAMDREFPRRPEQDK